MIKIEIIINNEKFKQKTLITFKVKITIKFRYFLFLCWANLN